MDKDAQRSHRTLQNLGDGGLSDDVTHEIADVEVPLKVVGFCSIPDFWRHVILLSIIAYQGNPVTCPPARNGERKFVVRLSSQQGVNSRQGLLQWHFRQCRSHTCQQWGASLQEWQRQGGEGPQGRLVDCLQQNKYRRWFQADSTRQTNDNMWRGWCSVLVISHSLTPERRE